MNMNAWKRNISQFCRFVQLKLYTRLENGFKTIDDHRALCRTRERFVAVEFDNWYIETRSLRCIEGFGHRARVDHEIQSERRVG